MGKTTLYLDFIEKIGSKTLELEGYLGGKRVKLSDVHLKAGQKKIALSPVERVQSQDGLEYHKPIADSTFKARIEVKPEELIRITAIGPEGRLRIRTNQFSGLANLCFTYKAIGDWLLTLRLGRITIHRRTAMKRTLFEIATNLAILINLRIPRALQMIGTAKGLKNKASSLVKAAATILEALISVPTAIGLRWAYSIAKATSSRPIWLISDRTNAGGDNGEALFRYICEQKRPPARIYFVLSRRSEDYKRLKSIGPVVSYGGLRHLLLHLLADKVISSHADIQVYNPFIRQVDRYLDLFDFDFVFLQHGIIRHDLSGWLNRYNRDIRLFIVSSEDERQRILSDNYYYAKDNIVLSGLPRYDQLNSQPKNKLIIMPTYRSHLVKGLSNKKGERSYDPGFKQTEYYRFYNQLINDARLLETLTAHEMTGELYVHPMFFKQLQDFHGNPTFRVMRFPYDYQKALTQGSLLVTDYSSVVFDFAYMRKPIIYAQFDAEEFFNNRDYMESGGTDDTKDGFGPVCDNYRQLVDETISTIENGLKMPAKYSKRVDNYFKYSDRGNTERVYRAILKLDKRGKQ